MAPRIPVAAEDELISRAKSLVDTLKNNSTELDDQSAMDFTTGTPASAAEVPEDDLIRKAKELVAQLHRGADAAGSIRLQENAEIANPRLPVAKNPRIPSVNPHPNPNQPSQDSPNPSMKDSAWRNNEEIPGLAAGTSAAAAAAYALAPAQGQAAEPAGPVSKEPPLKTGASFGLIARPLPGKPDPFGKMREDAKTLDFMQQAELGSRPNNPQTLDDLLSSQDLVGDFQRYLKNKGFAVNTPESSSGDKLYNATPIASAKNTLKALELILSPVVRSVQDNVGRPLVESYIEHVLPRQQKMVDTIRAQVGLNPETEGSKAANELLLRSAGMLVAGPDLLEKAPEKVQRLGVTGLEDKFGETGAAFSLALAQKVGEAPLFLIGPGKWVELGNAAKVAIGSTRAARVLGKLAADTMAGAHMGLLTAIATPERETSEIAPGITYAEGALGGALLGGAFAAMGRAFSALNFNNRAAARMLEEFALEDKANIERARLVRDAWMAGKKARLEDELAARNKPTTVAEILASKKSSPRPPPEPPPVPVKAIISSDGLKQLQVEVLSFPKRQPRPDVPAKYEWAQVHMDPEYGPVVNFTEAIGIDGTPRVSVVPLTDEVLDKLAKSTVEQKGKIGISMDFDFRGPQAKKALDTLFESIVQGTPGAAAERMLKQLEEAAAKAPQKAPNPRSFAPTQPGRKRPRPAAVEVPASDPRPPSGPDAMVVEVVGGDPNDAFRLSPVRVAQDRLPEEEPTILTNVWDAIHDTFPSKPRPSSVASEMEVSTKVPLGGEFQAFDLPADAPRASGKTGPGTTNPLGVPEKTQPATVNDLVKMGFDLPNIGKGGVGGGSYRGGDPGKTPVGFLGEGGGKPPNEPPTAKGSALPEPPPRPELPSGRTPDNAPEFDDLQEAMRIAKQQLSATRSMGRALEDFFISNHLRGPTWFSAWKTSYQASQVAQRASEEIAMAAKRNYKTTFLSDLDRKLDRLFKSPAINKPGGFEAEWQKVMADIPEKLRADAKLFSMNLLNERAQLERRLAALGYVPEKLLEDRNAALLDLYLTRRYLAYALPQGEWARVMGRDGMAEVRNEAITYLYNQAKERGLNLTPAEVAEDFLSLIKLNDPIAAFKAGHARLSPLKALMQRGDIPAPLRKALGEIESGMANIAMTLGTQRSLVARYELLHDLHARGPSLWSDAFSPAMGHTFKIPENRAFGPMAGKYVDRDTFEGITNLPKSDVAAHEFIRNVLGFMKGNDVALGGLGPLINSTMGNLFSGTLAGGLDFNLSRSGRALRDAVEAMVDHYKDPTGQRGKGWIVNEARRMGADFFGFSHEEIGNASARKFVEEVLNALPKQENWDVYKVWGTITKIASKYRGLQEKFGSILDMNDRLFRLQSYIALREKFLEDLAKNGEKSILFREGLLSNETLPNVVMTNKFGDKVGVATVGPGSAMMKAKAASTLAKVVPQELANRVGRSASSVNWGAYYEDPELRKVVEAAASLAARRVNQSFWNPTFLGKGPEAIRKGYGGFVARYATAAFESMRVNLTALWRLRSESDLRWRLAALVGMVGTAFGVNGLMRQWNGISDDEVEKAMRNIPSSRKASRPFLEPMAWRDSKGRIQLWNYTNYFDPLRLFSGSTNDPAFSKFVSNALAMNFLEGGSLERPVSTMAEATGLLGKQPQYPVFDPNASHVEKIFRTLNAMSLTPKLLRDNYEAARLNDALPGWLGVRSNTEEALTPGQTAAKMLGVTNIVPSGSASALGSVLERKAAFNEFKKDMRKVGINKQMDSEEKERRRQDIKDTFQRRKESW